MAKHLRKRVALAQNFFRCTDLVRGLVAASCVGRTDTVVEIGPGTGIITQELARVARRVVAIEKDATLATRLKQRFRAYPHVETVQGDFLTIPLEFGDYKIFASIPFNVTAPIMRKILDGRQPPLAAYLVLQKEAAQKFAGTPSETQASILAKPWFDFQIVRELQRTDFDPVPGVDIVFLQIKKRDPPLIMRTEAALYRQFVRYGFGVWKSSLRLIYQPIFSHQQWHRLARELHFAPNVTPTQLRFDQWLGLFAGFRWHVPPIKQAIIVGRW